MQTSLPDEQVALMDVAVQPDRRSVPRRRIQRLLPGGDHELAVDPTVVAPVLCQPSAPFTVGSKRSRDLNLSPADLDIVKGRCAAGQQVLGLRYLKDPAVGKRFETLTTELGDAFIRVEFEGKGHSTVTAHRQQEGVDAVLDFFAENLSRTQWSNNSVVLVGE